MHQKNKFKELNQNAFAIFTKLFSEDASENSEIEELSRKSFEIAQKWDNLEEERLKIFYSDERNRSDWIKSIDKHQPLSKRRNEDVYIGESEYGNKYWVLPILASTRTPIFATFLEIDEGDLIFSTDESPKFRIKEILVNNN